jgi:hypothetical protein
MLRIFIFFICFLLCSCAVDRERLDLSKVQQRVQHMKIQANHIDTTLLKGYIRELKRRNVKAIKFNDTLELELSDRTYRNFFADLGGEYVLYEHDQNGDIKKVTRFHSSGFYVEEKIDEYFTYLEQYYPNGWIQSRSIMSNFNFYIGKKYYYDEKGNLINVFDTDNGYRFTYKDALMFYIRTWKKLRDDRYHKPVRINKTVIAEDNDRKIWLLRHID